MGDETKGGNLRRFNEGDIIFQEKEMHPYMYKVLKGKIGLYVNYDKQGESVLGILNEEKFFGEISMLTGKPQVYTAVAIEDVLLMRVEEGQLEQFLYDNRSNILGMMKSMARIIVTQNMDISLLMEDISEMMKSLPKETKIDSRIEMRLKQYQLKYIEKSCTPEMLMFSAKG
ncbi:cyclic nucleotide-binding domain-containing protein [Oribacterium sp. WCC10]|uniref:cyclic nucleotide-binding domain-containing protein n=1 Tax=Oribacterium sp. WCC10 TaxID=1855343 RepID=UPI0008F2E55C|nr:Crp/Fnr family transcriptional regulator [Oribacterium sp. WCC10]SFG39286.1 cAMP-binding domain of CRP or a regulatory subunit of cAMP-dependent protein kinases [Oribacterium sp. WCC10]